MTEQEAREIMREHGWSFLHRKRRNRSYVYAARKRQGQRQELYIGPFAILAKLDLDQLKAKLQIVVTSQCSIGQMEESA